MKARHSIDAHIATAQFDARTIVNFIKRRTLSMIIDVKLQVDLTKAFVFACSCALFALRESEPASSGRREKNFHPELQIDRNLITSV